MIKRLSRRTLLRGTGTALALPFLEAMMPKAWAQAAKPLRLLSWYFPCGYYRATVNNALRDDWTPAQTGAAYTLSPILAPLMPYQADLQIVSGITNPPADTAPLSCAHARGTGSFLTCVAPQGDASDGISMDQVAAGALGHNTRFPSLELGTNNAGGDTPIRSTIAWADAATPLSHESRAEALFDRLFATTMESPAEAAKRKLYSKSVLDSVLGSANTLRGRLGSGDQQKLDGYLNGVRELETRLDSPAVSCTARSDRRHSDPDEEPARRARARVSVRPHPGGDVHVRSCGQRLELPVPDGERLADRLGPPQPLASPL
jgi:hypothetical protein